MRSPLVTLRATPPLARLLDRDRSAGAIAARDLQRYYAALDRASRALPLSEPEWNYLRDILNGSALDETTAAYLWAEVADAIEATEAHWGIDAADLSARLRGLDGIALLAICDAIERWWDAQRVSGLDPAT